MGGDVSDSSAYCARETVLGFGSAVHAFEDLTGVFNDEVRTIYIDNCCHPDEFGCEFMAERMAERILALFASFATPAN